jgi:pyruvate,water dikinase
MKSKNRIEGRSACKGRVRGRPVVVHDVGDLESVRPGDILVSLETEVLFVPAMHRAAAVVTERGGRFCHAAVWARENSKPTIVGAEGAMAALALVDVVEVDADSGLVTWA